MRRYRFVLIAVAVVMTGCASLSTFQTAQVLEKGEKQMGFALSASQIDVGDSDDAALEAVTILVPEFFYRAPIGEKSEFGVKLTPTSLVADGKYQLVDSTPFDMAADLGLGFFAFAAEGEALVVVDIHPAIIASLNLSESVSLNLTPKFIVRYIAAGGESETSYLNGGTIGLALGKNTRFMPEVGFYRWENEDSGFAYFGLGIAW